MWYKKLRCVYNGSPRIKGTVILAHTYAAALEQSGARMFWVLTALHNYTVYGADATKAFAEAPPLWLRYLSLSINYTEIGGKSFKNDFLSHMNSYCL